MNISVGRTRFGAVLFVFGSFLTVAIANSRSPVLAAALQDSGQAKLRKSVWDGVYTTEQSARGKGEYEDNCAHCHSTGEAPALGGDAFMRRWFNESLNALFTKIRTQMPQDAPGSLSEKSYVDVIAFLLATTGFPAGAAELTPTPELLEGLIIVEKEGGAVPNFSLVQVVGCLTQGTDKAWILTNASEPVRAKDVGDSEPSELKGLEAKPLGTQTLRLLDFPLLGRDKRRGHRVQAKGFLIRQSNRDDQINLSALQTLAETCP